MKLSPQLCIFSINLAGELCNAVQDAFVIAVEQQARERLQRLSALKRITPVDMSQLSIKVRVAPMNILTEKSINFYNFLILVESAEHKRIDNSGFQFLERRIPNICDVTVK